MTNNKKKKRKQISEEKRSPFFNIIHGIIFIFLLIYTLHGIYMGKNIQTENFWEDLRVGFQTTGLNEIFTFIGAVAFILFGIVGIYEFAYSSGIRFLYPPIYGILRERRNEKIAEIMMRTYYENDKEFLHNFEKERLGSILKVLRIDETQFRRLNYELLRARSMPEEDLSQLQEKAEVLAFDESFIIDLTKIPPADRVYKDVNYYVNLYTAVYDDNIRHDLGAIMAHYIILLMKEELQEIDYIIIPHNSNLLLGLEVGKRLGKPVIYIQDKPRVYRERYWDGEYECRPGHTNQIIILHDILVTGNRISDAVLKLTPDTYNVRGLFCLAKYNHPNFQPENILMKKIKLSQENIYCLLSTSETELQNRLP